MTSDLIGKIWNEDCLETMRRMEDGSVDLIVTDPPYGIGGLWVGGSGNGWGPTDKEKRVRNAWDSAIPTDKHFAEMFRVADTLIIWGGNYFPLPPSRCWLLWVKPERNFTLAEAECAWTNADSVTRVWEGNRHLPNREHPTQKPLELISWCMAQSWSRGVGTVYDPFMGSGTTAVACEKLGRKWIGSEINPDYCRIAEKRIEAVRAQGNLFEVKA